MSTVQIRDLPAAASLDGSELVELQKAAGGAGSSEQAPIGAITPPGYIDGLKMVWVSGTALTITSGAAYIQSLGRVLRVPSDIAKAGLTLSASTWYHVYLFFNGAAADFELSTTAPAAPYNGTARTKTGDTSRRYVGSVRTDNSGQLFRFAHHDEFVRWMLTPSSFTNFRVLSGGAAITSTTVSLSGGIPSTCKLAYLRLTNFTTDLAATVYMGTPAVPKIFSVDGGQSIFCEAPTDDSQNIAYQYNAAPSSGGGYIDVYGFHLAR